MHCRVLVGSRVGHRRSALCESPGLCECSLRDLGKASGADKMYRSLLNDGKNKKCCPLCARSMDSKVMSTFEKAVCMFWPAYFSVILTARVAPRSY